jgi:formamidopyrimidine-DNA glycosylase
MPELPEVETVRRGLAPVMEGATIARLELRRKDLRFPFPERFLAEVEGRRIIALSRRAKYLLIELDNDTIIIAHLGMSGSFRILEGQETDIPGHFHHERAKDEKHDHVIFHLERNDTGMPGHVRVVYNDPRRFGFMDMTRRETMATQTFLKDLGPEPTGNSLDALSLAKRFRTKNQPLKSALLDQKNIAGLGNIYVCEAMFRAGLSPELSANRLVQADGAATPELEKLVVAIRNVIDDAIAAGGSSLRDHIQTDGSLGYFQHSFRVYDREGQACSNAACGSVIGRIVQAGRSTFFCPHCQKG